MEKLSQTDKDMITRAYEESDRKGKSRKKLQKKLSKQFDVSERTIRRWAKDLGVGVMTENQNNPSKIMIYDIETSRIRAWVWWTGKQHIGHHQLIDEPKIITVSWKWLGDEEIKYLKWDENHCDRELMEGFLKEYNKADMVVGYNNDRFDNRWINARAMKHGLEVNPFVRSFDIMKEEKKHFRVPSYSMAYMAEYSNVVHKQGHEGLLMWDMIQTGTPEQQEEYLQKMIDYNVGDIAATEELYMRMRPYFGHRMHFGVYWGGEKFSCPDTGSTDVEFYKRTVTPAGTVQIIMKSNETGKKYKITNKQYMNFLDFKMANHDKNRP